MATKPDNNKAKDLTLEDWEIKSILQDIEESGHSVDDVTLELLEGKNPDWCGTGRNPKFRMRRAAVSSKLQDFKRRAAPSCLRFVRGHNVLPSKFTIANAEAVEQQNVKNKKANVEDVKMEDVAGRFKTFGVDDDDDSFSFRTDNVPPPPFRATTPPPCRAATPPTHHATPPPPPPVFSPPRSASKLFKSPMKTGFGTSVPGSVFTAPTTIPSSSSSSGRGECSGNGSHERPWKFDLISGFSGRCLNGIWAHEETKQIKDKKMKNGGSKKHGHQGHPFKRKVDPPDVALNSCFLADEIHKKELCSKGALKADDLHCDVVVFRGPHIEAFDRVGTGSIIPHQFVSPESKETVRTCHTNIKPANETDESPGPSWAHTIAKVPESHQLDNRVFSDHDCIVTPCESMPPKVEVEDLGGEEVLTFHVMWRVALKGTEQLMDESTKLSLAERMKQRREQHGQADLLAWALVKISGNIVSVHHLIALDALARCATSVGGGARAEVQNVQSM